MQRVILKPAQTFPFGGIWSHFLHILTESQLGLKGARASPSKAALASAASERPCRVCSALCWPKGPTAGRPASSGWACSKNDQNRRSDLLVFPSALRMQTSSPCTLFPDCTVSRAHGLGPHKGSKAVVSPMEAGRSEASLGSGASQWQEIKKQMFAKSPIKLFKHLRSHHRYLITNELL